MKNILNHVALIIALSACSAGEKPAEGPANLPDSSAGISISLTEDQVRTIQLKTGSMKQQAIQETIKANGYLDVPPQNKAVISPMITGYIRKVNFLVGDNVRKGQTMAVLESMEFIDMQQTYRELSARLVFLKAEYERQKLLREQDAVSKKSFLEAESAYHTVKSSTDGLKAKLGMLGIDLQKLNQGQIEQMIYLRAPISGSVKRQNAMIGRHVDPSEEIYELVNTEHLHLELSIYENDILQVKKDQNVRFTIPSMQDKTFEGEVFLVGSDLSEDKRTINVHVHIHENNAAFTVGMYAQAAILTQEHHVYSLPVTSIVGDGESRYVFREIGQTDDQRNFERVPVQTGQESNGIVEIINVDDFATTDKVVTYGAYYLLNALNQVSVAEAE